MKRLSILLFLLTALVALASASAPSFCKCTCFKNSTLVPLDDANTQNDHSSSLRRSASLFAPLQAVPIFGVRHEKRESERRVSSRATSGSCSQCTKAFCLAQNLDICKDATEADVVTMCFQRDSNKDKIIVWGFILGTLGLLGWATFRKVMDRREAAGLGRLGAGYNFLGRGRN